VWGGGWGYRLGATPACAIVSVGFAVEVVIVVVIVIVVVAVAPTVFSVVFHTLHPEKREEEKSVRRRGRCRSFRRLHNAHLDQLAELPDVAAHRVLQQRPEDVLHA